MPIILLTEDDNMTTPAKPSTPNKLYSHLHVEDYIEIIAGHRLPDGKNNHSIFTLAEPVVSLARYDMKVVPSLAEQTLNNKGYTDKQAKLAADLVLKYERQLFKLGLDVSPVRTPQYRLPIRKIDRSTRVWVENDLIKLRFPYDITLIEEVRDVSKISKGSFKFNRESRIHEADLTEWNLNWIYGFAKQQQFEIDSTITDLMTVILDAEQVPYPIELRYKNDHIEITNAADSLISYINDHLGGLTTDNLFRLIDLAPILGYDVAKEIEETVIAEFGTRFWSLCNNRQLKVDSMTNNTLVKDIIEYARATNRFPIYVYEPDLSERLKTEFNKYFSGELITLTKDLVTIPENIKVVYTTKIPKISIERIPLMISSAGMLYGGDRQMWIQTAEKVVYFTKDVYNKNTKGPDVCKLD
jgi:hypothetical protein